MIQWIASIRWSSHRTNRATQALVHTSVLPLALAWYFLLFSLDLYFCWAHSGVTNVFIVESHVRPPDRRSDVVWNCIHNDTIFCIWLKSQIKRWLNIYAVESSSSICSSLPALLINSAVANYRHSFVSLVLMTKKNTSIPRFKWFETRIKN